MPKEGGGAGGRQAVAVYGLGEVLFGWGADWDLLCNITLVLGGRLFRVAFPVLCGFVLPRGLFLGAARPKQGVM